MRLGNGLGIAVFILCFCNFGDCAPYEGVAAYAALSPRFPCRCYLASLSGSVYPAMSVLLGTFGNSFSCIEDYIDRYRKREKWLEIHLSNESCRRNDRCYQGELRKQMSVGALNRAIATRSPRVIRDIRGRLARLAANLRQVYSNVGLTYGDSTRIVVSMGLESAWGSRSQLVLKGLIEEYGFEALHNPVNPRRDAIGGLIELHTDYERRTNYVAVNDGIPLNYSQLRHYKAAHRDAVAVLLWDADLQGRFYPFEFVRPSDRSFRCDLHKVEMYKKLFKGD
jgi:hypothetical protein